MNMPFGLDISSLGEQLICMLRCCPGPPSKHALAFPVWHGVLSRQQQLFCQLMYWLIHMWRCCPGQNMLRTYYQHIWLPMLKITSSTPQSWVAMHVRLQPKTLFHALGAVLAVHVYATLLWWIAWCVHAKCIQCNSHMTSYRRRLNVVHASSHFVDICIGFIYEDATKWHFGTMKQLLSCCSVVQWIWCETHN